MAYKKTNFQTFTARLTSGEGATFTCRREKTRYGFRHVCEGTLGAGLRAVRASKAWYNRPWEDFTYASVLRKAIDKYPADVAAELRAQIINGTAKAEHERCEAEFSVFKALYDQQTPGMKKALAGVTLSSEDDVKTVTGIMKAATILNSIK